jgi:hypothetical protein
MKTSLVNCRFWHTYQDEDCVGSVKQIARKVHRRLLELRLLGRWLLRLGSYNQGRTNQPLRSAARWKNDDESRCGPWELRNCKSSGSKTSKFQRNLNPRKTKSHIWNKTQKVIYECRFWGATEVTRAYGRKYFEHSWMLDIVTHARC